MLIVALLTLSITMNVINLFAAYRSWLWCRVSASVGHPFAFASTRALKSAWDILRVKR